MPDNLYNTGDMTRSLDKMLHFDLQPGQKQRPLLHIPTDQMVVDELHLLLRITAVLERNVVLEMVEWDKLEGITSLSKGQHLKAFLYVVKELGISFSYLAQWLQESVLSECFSSVTSST